MLFSQFAWECNKVKIWPFQNAPGQGNGNLNNRPIDYEITIDRIEANRRISVPSGLIGVNSGQCRRLANRAVGLISAFLDPNAQI